jgi:hypothetical protein
MSPDEAMAILAIVFGLVPGFLIFSLVMWIQRMKSHIKVMWRPTDYTAAIVTKKPDKDGFVVFGDHAVSMNPQGAYKKMPQPIMLKTRFGHMPFYKMSYKSSVPEGWTDAEKTQITGQELKSLHDNEVLKAITSQPKVNMTLLVIGILVGAALAGLGVYTLITSGVIHVPTTAIAPAPSQNAVTPLGTAATSVSNRNT